MSWIAVIVAVIMLSMFFIELLFSDDVNEATKFAALLAVGAIIAIGWLYVY